MNGKEQREGRKRKRKGLSPKEKNETLAHVLRGMSVFG